MYTILKGYNDVNLYVIFIFRMLQEKLDQPVSAPPSPRDINNGDLAANLTMHVQHLRNEVAKLKTQLLNAQQEREFNFDV